MLWIQLLYVDVYLWNRGHQVAETGMIDICGPQIWVVGIEPWFSGRVAMLLASPWLTTCFILVLLVSVCKISLIVSGIVDMCFITKVQTQSLAFNYEKLKYIGYYNYLLQILFLSVPAIMKIARQCLCCTVVDIGRYTLDVLQISL